MYRKNMQEQKGHTQYKQEYNTIQAVKTSLIPELKCHDFLKQKCQTEYEKKCHTRHGQQNNTNYNKKYTIKDETDYRVVYINLALID